MLAARAVQRALPKPRYILPKRCLQQVRKQHDQTQPPIASTIPAPSKPLRNRVDTSEASRPRPLFLLGRLLNTIVYVSLFGITGFALAWGWKTWDYLYMGKMIGSPAIRIGNKEFFGKKVDKSPLVQSLRDAKWIEESTRTAVPVKEGHSTSTKSRGQHMVNEKLVENGYLATKSFRHPTDGMTVLVFMADFACESWPNTLHGGIATTVIQEALDAHLEQFPGYSPVRDRETVMNYRLPLHPAIVYGVLVRTDKIETLSPSATTAEPQFVGIGVEISLNEMDKAPQYIERQNASLEAIERVCNVQHAQKGIGAYIQGVSTLMLASKNTQSQSKGDQQSLLTLQEHLDAWKATYRYIKPRTSK